MRTNSAERGINILMYHSISDGPGPTNIPTDTFRAQMDVLCELDYKVVPLAEYARWHRGEQDLADRSVVITFDDGFLNFATDAFPLLHDRGWTATVFIPTGRLGGLDEWEPRPSRRLMSWSDVKRLSRRGVDFGAHTVTHQNLTKASNQVMVQEIVESQRAIEQQLECHVPHFAPPYGKSNQAVRAEISKHFELSFGTALDRAPRHVRTYDLPRIEMHYFRDIKLWSDYLAGRAEIYFAKRKLLRRIRHFAGID